VSAAGGHALGARRFRLYLLGQIVSQSGTAAQQIGLAWLMYRLSGSSALVGLTVLLTQLPILVLSPIAGLLADRFDRRSVLLTTEIAGAVQALALTLAAATQVLSIAALLGLSLLLGVINAFSVPARQAIVPLLLDRPAHIRTAVALSSASLHFSRLLGSALAAAILVYFDVSVCFLGNAISYLASIFVLIRLGSTMQAPIGRMSVGTLRDGLRYCLAHRELRRILRLVIVTSLLLIPYTVLLPAATYLWSGAHAAQFARIMSAAGLGSLLAALALALRHEGALLRRVMPASALVGGACLVVLGLVAASLPSSAVLAVVALLGFSLTLVISGANVTIQHQIPEALRGRVMGLFVMSFNGVAALGNLLWGTVSDHYGIALTFTGAGLLAALFAAADWAAAANRSVASAGA
jgi:MFS family permease